MRAMYLRMAVVISLQVFMLMLAGCTQAQPPEPAPSQATGAAVRDRKEVLAPIESADVLIRETFPVQYALHIVSGLPSGCASFHRLEIDRRDSAIYAKVWNTVPTDPSVACTMIYGTKDNTSVLAGDFKSGKKYDVYVNGELKTTFTAQ
jgi:hypothetical protein